MKSLAPPFLSSEIQNLLKTILDRSSIQRPVEVDGAFTYDDNGNMTQRVEGGITWTQTFNAENRLASVSDGADTWQFTYDGDGTRVRQQNPDNTITLFLGGGIYTVEDAAGSPEVTKYYSIAGQRVAMDNSVDGLQYLLTDHLGSVSAVLSDQGVLVSQQRYLPFGGLRLDPGITQTDFAFTGQRALAAVGLMDYNARWYGQTVGAFTQPDTIVANLGNPQSLNRFSYVLNNPLRMVDPTGRCPAVPQLILNGGCSYLMRSSSTTIDLVGPGPESDLPVLRYCQLRPNDCDRAGAVTRAECNANPSQYGCAGKPIGDSESPGVTIPIQGPSQTPEKEEDPSDPELEALLWFWQNMAQPTLDFIEATNWGYYYRHLKYLRWSIPTGPIEGAVAGLSQYQGDAGNSTLSVRQMRLRALTVGIETVISDQIGSVAAQFTARAGLLCAQGAPGCMAAAYFGTNLAVTALFEEIIWKKVNASVFPEIGFGEWP